MTRTYLPDAFATDKVEAMVKLLGLDPLDAEQWDFLQSEKTQDLQAAPGSGKTTLIGLKLALMADAWTSPTRGVCVPSHGCAPALPHSRCPFPLREFRQAEGQCFVQMTSTGEGP